MTGVVSPRNQGKVPRGFLERFVFPHLGAPRESLIVGPGHGMDNSVIALDGRKVVVLTSDPLSIIPAIGLRESAWLSVHLLASDLTTSGVSPQFAVLDFNLPPEMKLSAVATYLRAVGDECRKLGIAIAAGHTGRYAGSGYTVVGGGMMFSMTSREAYVTPAMARAGDVVMMTKGAAIGATAILSRSFPETVRRRVGEAIHRKASNRLRDCSTVEDARVAASVGLHKAVTSMHDATEGGVLGGLFELSSACSLPVLAVAERIHVPEESSAVCAVFKIDPLTSTSEGTLLITCRPNAATALRSALAKSRIEAYEIGKVGRPEEGNGLFVSREGGSVKRKIVPSADAYWSAYANAIRRGLK